MLIRIRIVSTGKTYGLSFPNKPFLPLVTLSSHQKKICWTLWDTKPWWLQTTLNNPHPHILFFMIFEHKIRIFSTLSDIQQLFLFGSKFSAEYRIVPNNVYQIEYSYILTFKMVHYIMDIMIMSMITLVQELEMLKIK